MPETSIKNGAQGVRRVAVIGAGAWGTTLALHASRQGLAVSLWARRPQLAERLRLERENVEFLPGHKLPGNMIISSDPEEVALGAETVVWVVPSHAFRAAAKLILPKTKPGAVHLSASKGIEDETFSTMTSILKQEAGGEILAGALSGPSFAKEVASGLPTAVTLAFECQNTAKMVQTLLSAPGFRLYTSQDVQGVELGGALKNVYAIAAGISDGLNLGLNARAALITRGINEMSRLARVMGANPMTLSGLSGIGDLILTATGELSRNRRVGLRIGLGEKLSDIVSGSHEVAEGVRNAKSVWGLAQAKQVSLPTAREVFRVLYENKPPKQGLVDLLTRRLKDELPADLLLWGQG
ncbi:MAG: NAD(P)-dependent glycerol-3-phosphate dehydrogenase [Deltaproteobacteria bacterium]|nr:NAD(P)-dependent glycerol-3-phosphate dehydrogenase [Deltaproteobacteria bacterium]